MDIVEGQNLPPPDDRTGWRCVVDDGRLPECPNEALVSAIQAMGLGGDKKTINAMMKHLSDEMLRTLRKAIGKNHANEGVDMIERAHGQLIEAVLQPNSADGAGLRVAFKARVQMRAVDAIRAVTKSVRREPSYEVEGTIPAVRKSDWSDSDEHAYVESVLRHVEDPRKRAAFWLHMQGVPKGSGKFESIAKALGVTRETAGEWVAQVQEQLKTIVGDER